MSRRLSLTMLLGLITVAVLSFGLTAGAAPDEAAGESELEAAQRHLAELRIEEAAARAAHDDAVIQMGELETQIDASARDLEAAEADLAEAQRQLQELVAQMYTSGNVSYLDVLVGAKNFSEFANQLEVWVDLIGQQRATFDDLLAARDSLAEQKAELENQRDQQAAALADADAQVIEAEGLEGEAEAYLDSLNAQLREEMEAEQARQAEQARIEGEKLAAKLDAQQQAAAAQQQQAAAEQATAEADARRAEAAEQAEAAEAAAEQAEAAEAAAEQAEAEQAEAEQAEAEQAEAEQAEAEQAEAEQAAAEEAAALYEEKKAEQAKAEQARLAEEADEGDEANARRAARLAELAEQQLAEEQAAAEEAAAEQAAAEEAATLAAEGTTPTTTPEGTTSTTPEGTTAADDQYDDSTTGAATGAMGAQPAATATAGGDASCADDFGGVQPHVAQIGCDLQEQFGLRITGIGYSDYHWDGLDLDIWTTDVTLGNQVRDYTLAKYPVEYTCWQDSYVNILTGWEDACPGHMDHVHITFLS